jgi:hypothetical protein
MGFDLGGLLRQYVNGTDRSTHSTEDHFQQASDNAPASLVSRGLAAAFRSDATPSFGQMAGELFGRSNPNQQAGMLNQLIAGMGPGVLTSLLRGAAASGLGGLLGQLTRGGTQTTLSPAQASQLSAEQVQVIASHAEHHNPGIIDEMSGFYAEHPTLVKTLGSAALSITLAKMAEYSRA